MDIAKTYWLLNHKINQPKVEYYQYSNKTPYQKGLEALDYFRYYGGKPLDIEKTYYNRLLMPIFDDLDLFQLQITKLFLEFKEFQANFRQDEAVKDLKNLNKTIPLIVKEIIKNNKNHIKSIKEELKITKNGIKEDIRQTINSQTVFLPFVQFMQKRELKAQELMKNIKFKFQMNSNKVRNLRENLLVQENLIEKMEAKKEVERFNDYLINFKKDLESRARIMKIERTKMKINDIQMNLEKEMLKQPEMIKIRRKVVCLGMYKYDEFKIVYNKSDNKSSESEEKSSNKSIEKSSNKIIEKSSIKSKKTKKTISKSNKSRKMISDNNDKEKNNNGSEELNESESDNDNDKGDE